MLKTQALFKKLGSRDAIEFLKAEPRNIQVKEYPDFVVLNYNQIFSKEDDDYVMECRSLQLDYAGNVVSRAFPRFFNYGQRPEITEKFDFASASFYEKADGSLIRIYWNPFSNQWEAATRGTAYAESEQNFYLKFRQAIIEDGLGLPNEDAFQNWCDLELVQCNTYVFEYCSMKNNIVTPYETPQMVLLSIIDNETGEEYDYGDIVEALQNGWFLSQNVNVRLVNKFCFASYEAMKDALDTLPDLQEGFVAQDKNGLRVKFKNDLYLKLHKMRGDLGFTEKKIAEIVVEGEEGEVLTYFSQYKHLFDPIVEARAKVFTAIEVAFNNYQTIEDQKTFALNVKELPYSALLFTMRNRNKSFEQAWGEARLEYKVDLLLGIKS